MKGIAGSGDGNRAQAKRFQLALRRVLEEYADDRVQRGNALTEIATNLVREALQSQPWAIQEIANRLDGKPKQQMEMTGDEDNPVAVAVKGVIELVRPG